jgi:protein-L-isoaspartate(D-aspartate) O-methyltransferase
MTRRAGLAGASRAGLLAAAIVLCAAAAWVLHALADKGADNPAAPAAGQAPEKGAPASRPATRTATTKPLKPWKPPRITARQTERAAMVRTIRSYGLTDRAILDAMNAVARHEFVGPGESDYAYRDTPLPIGYGQTISQPYIVAEMTRQLKLAQDSRVLEIGTGSGYQAAVLSEFTRHVYTVEIIKPLAEAANKRLRRLGYHVIEVRHGDGYFGWAEKGPFDAIIVTCAAGQVPPPLIQQLKPGGRMVIPVGGAFATQYLMLIEKQKDGSVRSRSLGAVRFVPLTRKDATAK